MPLTHQGGPVLSFPARPWDRTMHETAQILCPGPSLRDHIGNLPKADIRIGVNRAVTAVLCDWWVFGDWLALQDFIPIGKPNVFTHRKAESQLQQHVGPLHFYTVKMLLDSVERAFYDDVTTDCPVRLDGCTWSLVAALIFVEWHLDGCLKRIDLFGVDWKGEEDWDGRAFGERSPERWERERIDVMRAVNWLMGKGVEVNGIPV
jgi:hypothetical protein